LLVYVYLNTYSFILTNRVKQTIIICFFLMLFKTTGMAISDEEISSEDSVDWHAMITGAIGYKICNDCSFKRRSRVILTEFSYDPPYSKNTQNAMLAFGDLV